MKQTYGFLKEPASAFSLCRTVSDVVSANSENTRSFHCFFQLSVEFLAELGQRKPNPLTDHAHTLKRPFHGNGIGFQEEFAIQRHQKFVQALRFFPVARDSRGAEIGHGFWGYVCGNRNVTLRAGENKFSCSSIVAEIHGQASIEGFNQLRTPGILACASLIATMFGMSAKRRTVSFNMSQAVRPG